MSQFQKTDMFVTIGETAYILRLTLGALAEIDAKLGVKGPLELAEKLKTFCGDEKSHMDAHQLLECILRPAFSSPVHASFTDISTLAQQADPQVFMPVITRLFEAIFKAIATENT